MYSFVKNKFVKNVSAKISIQERGFRFGDGIFDTINICHYQPYQWSYHKDKLLNNLKQLKICLEIDFIEEICKKLVKINNFKKGLLRISISRGIGSSGFLPSKDIKPLLIVETIKRKISKALPCKIMIGSFKKIPSNSFYVNMKTHSSLQSCMLRIEAQDMGCDEAILLANDDRILEGSSSNIFWVKDGRIYTPEDKGDIYLGSIRNAILTLCPKIIQQGNFFVSDLLQADEIFLTNANWLVRSVRQVKPFDRNFDSDYMTKKMLGVIKKDMENSSW